MSIELIGFIITTLGLSVLIFGPRFACFAFLCSALLSAASAVSFPALGGLNLQPGYYLLGFVLLDALMRPRVLKDAAIALAPFKPGFWFAAMLLYAIPVTILVPRLFAGSFYVFSVGRSEAGAATILQVPVGPSSGNVTQPVYLLAGLLCFLTFYAYRRSPALLHWFSRAVLWAALLNLTFAALDLITYHTGTQAAMDIIRNASYRLLTDVELLGFKRVVGSFSEASAFAAVSVLLFAFTVTLWLHDSKSRMAGLAALGSFIAVLLSTSTGGYAAIGMFIAFHYAMTLMAVLKGAASKREMIWACAAPLFLICFVVFVIAYEPLRYQIADLFDVLFFTKMSSDSGIERASWNQQAVVALFETFGIGAGIGTVRASSWLIAVPATLGIFGAVTYAMFIYSVFRTKPIGGEEEIAVQSAARMACVAMIFSTSLSGGGPDLGPFFYAMAGIACSNALEGRAAQRAPMRVESSSLTLGAQGRA